MRAAVVLSSIGWLSLGDEDIERMFSILYERSIEVNA
jgi:hypothetical protein